jgi:diguanylate cyclase (GGDEF)-like protein
MNYIYKWYYINELSVASELQNSILEEITILSITDELTKIFNRRHIESLISDAMNQYNETRSNNGFCVAIIDIDRFKYINDNFGHKKGDEVLIKFSEIFRENLRQNDKIGRWGGDEFLILFSDMSITEAKNFMENQQKLLLSTDFDIDFSLSFSYGIKVYDSSLDYTQFFRIIDHLLYTNKNSKQSD